MVGSYNPLTAASRAGNLEMVQLLHESGADINQQDTVETKSASEVERGYPNERLRSAIERAEESAKYT